MGTIPMGMVGMGMVGMVGTIIMGTAGTTTTTEGRGFALAARSM